MMTEAMERGAFAHDSLCLCESCCVGRQQEYVVWHRMQDSRSSLSFNTSSWERKDLTSSITSPLTSPPHLPSSPSLLIPPQSNSNILASLLPHNDMETKDEMDILKNNLDELINETQAFVSTEEGRKSDSMNGNISSIGSDDIELKKFNAKRPPAESNNNIKNNKNNNNNNEINFNKLNSNIKNNNTSKTHSNNNNDNNGNNNNLVNDISNESHTKPAKDFNKLNKPYKFSTFFRKTSSSSSSPLSTSSSVFNYSTNERRKDGDKRSKNDETKVTNSNENFKQEKQKFIFNNKKNKHKSFDDIVGYHDFVVSEGVIDINENSAKNKDDILIEKDHYKNKSNDKTLKEGSKGNKGKLTLTPSSTASFRIPFFSKYKKNKPLSIHSIDDTINLNIKKMSSSAEKEMDQTLNMTMITSEFQSKDNNSDASPTTPLSAHSNGKTFRFPLNKNSFSKDLKHHKTETNSINSNICNNNSTKTNRNYFTDSDKVPNKPHCEIKLDFPRKASKQETDINNNIPNNSDHITQLNNDTKTNRTMLNRMYNRQVSLDTHNTRALMNKNSLNNTNENPSFSPLMKHRNGGKYLSKSSGSVEIFKRRNRQVFVDIDLVGNDNSDHSSNASSNYNRNKCSLNCVHSPNNKCLLKRFSSVSTNSNLSGNSTSYTRIIHGLNNKRINVKYNVRCDLRKNRRHCPYEKNFNLKSKQSSIKTNNSMKMLKEIFKNNIANIDKLNSLLEPKNKKIRINFSLPNSYKLTHSYNHHIDNSASSNSADTLKSYEEKQKFDSIYKLPNDNLNNFAKDNLSEAPKIPPRMPLKFSTVARGPTKMVSSSSIVVRKFKDGGNDLKVRNSWNDNLVQQNNFNQQQARFNQRQLNNMNQQQLSNFNQQQLNNSNQQQRNHFNQQQTKLNQQQQNNFLQQQQLQMLTERVLRLEKQNELSQRFTPNVANNFTRQKLQLQVYQSPRDFISTATMIQEEKRIIPQHQQQRTPHLQQLRQRLLQLQQQQQNPFTQSLNIQPIPLSTSSSIEFSGDSDTTNEADTYKMDGIMDGETSSYERMMEVALDQASNRVSTKRLSQKLQEIL